MSFHKALFLFCFEKRPYLSFCGSHTKEPIGWYPKSCFSMQGSVCTYTTTFNPPPQQDHLGLNKVVCDQASSHVQQRVLSLLQGVGGPFEVNTVLLHPVAQAKFFVQWLPMTPLLPGATNGWSLCTNAFKLL